MVVIKILSYIFFWCNGYLFYALICTIVFSCFLCFFFSGFLFNNPLTLLQDHFVLIVSEFMFIPWNYAQKQAAARASLQNSNSCTPSITIAAAETFESHLVEYLKGQVLIRILVGKGCLTLNSFFVISSKLDLLICTYTDQHLLHRQTYRNCSWYCSSH